MILPRLLHWPGPSRLKSVRGKGELDLQPICATEPIERVQAVMDGKWESGDNWAGIGSGVVQIGEITDAVPDHVKAKALAMIDSIGSESFTRLPGPSIGRTAHSGWQKAKLPMMARF